jgi:hypothetical protein
MKVIFTKGEVGMLANGKKCVWGMSSWKTNTAEFNNSLKDQ